MRVVMSEWQRAGQSSGDSRSGVKRKTERSDAGGLQQQVAGVGVIDLVIARGLLHERRLVGVAGVVFDRRHAALESQVAVEAVGQLGQPGRDVGVEPSREHAVRHDAQPAEQQAETIVAMTASRARRVSVTAAESVSM